jgi:hypothetical protein
MRIACIHVPQFALQCLSRIDPSLRGAAVAVVGAGVDPGAGVRPSLALHSPIVLACSRAAWALGIRLGMTASAARFVSPELRVVAADAQLERETVRAIADALLAVSAVVDTGGRVAAGGAHLAMYCEVPSKTRGATFGDRLLALLDTFGLAVRIGIADDRFTAWVAAAHGDAGAGVRLAAEDPKDIAGTPGQGAGGAWQEAAPRNGAGSTRQGHAGPRPDRGVISVPRGGSAGFLAPRPLSLLAITPEVQHMLESLGVRTLGEFAALPAPSVSRPLEADYQALARGDSGSALRPYAPEAPIREELATGSAASLFGGSAVVAALARRVALRLAGRARGAARLELTIVDSGLGGGLGRSRERVVPVTAARAASTQPELVELLAPQVGEGPIAKLRVVVVGEAIAGAASGAEEDTVGSIGEARSRGVGTPTALPAGRGSSPVGSIDAVSAALAGSGTAMPLLTSLDHLAPLAQASRAQPWQLSAPQTLRSERRDAHRRTRRAKQRRRTVTLAQSPLFGNLDG